MTTRKIKSESEMLAFGESFARTVQAPACIQLIGDVGVGKTTFMRGFAHGLGVTEPVSSPSFTISKEYSFGENGLLIHYDFYRLDDPGIMLDDLADALSWKNNIVAIEWADSATNILPEDRIVIYITENEDGSRTVEY